MAEVNQRDRRTLKVYVPGTDEATLKWLAAQDNMSLSIRQLVREAARQHGNVDVFSRPVLAPHGQVAPRPAVAPPEVVTRPAPTLAPTPAPVPRQVAEPRPAPAPASRPASPVAQVVPAGEVDHGPGGTPGQNSIMDFLDESRD